MAVTFQICIDCADPGRLARFWADALGYEIEPPPEGFATWDDYWRDVGLPEDERGTGADSITDPAGRGPRIVFHIVPEGKAVKNRVHLDIAPFADGDQAVAVAELQAAGASIADIGQGAVRWQVMTDPEGNEFCVLTPR